jgi:hypothetical protein
MRRTDRFSVKSLRCGCGRHIRSNSQAVRYKRICVTPAQSPRRTGIGCRSAKHSESLKTVFNNDAAPSRQIALAKKNLECGAKHRFHFGPNASSIRCVTGAFPKELLNTAEHRLSNPCFSVYQTRSSFAGIWLFRSEINTNTT